MKHKTNIIIFALLLLSISASAQIQFTAGLNYESGVPSGAPSSTGSRIRVNLATGRAYIWNQAGSNWRVLAQGIDIVAGCSAPLYTPGYGQSLFAVNGCASPDLYYYTGTAWVQINAGGGGGGTTYYAGEGIDITNDTISVDTVQRLSFRTDQTYSDGLGTLSWDNTNGTLQLGLKGGNVSLQLGQESVQLVKHADNTGLSNGKVVYLTGSSGGNLTVRYAQANSESTSANTFGVMTEDATGGNKAFCTTFGLVHNINTSNLTEGGMVWLSKDTAGAMTAVRPTAPNNGVEIGFCVTKHATNGVIFVTVQNGYELDELHNVYVPAPTNGQVLTYNTTNARWEAATVADQSATNELQTIDTFSLSGQTLSASLLNDGVAASSVTLPIVDVVAGTNVTVTKSNGVATVSATGGGGGGISGITQYIPKFNSSTTIDTSGLYWSTDGNLGIGTTSPTARLDIKGTAATDSTVRVGPELLTTGTGTGWSGTSFATGYTHSTGTTALTADGLTITAGTYYMVTVTVTGRTVGTCTATVGGLTTGAINTNTTVTVEGFATTTANFSVATSSTFNGTVTASLKERQLNNPIIALENSLGTTTLEIRGQKNASNTSIGVNSMGNITTGINNVVYGINAGKNITSANANSIFGSNAGSTLTSSGENCIFGQNAGNVLNGAQNCIFGAFAGQLLTSGGSNIFIGRGAGSTTTTGSNSILIGHGSRNNSVSSTYEIVIGNRTGFGNGTTVIGHSQTTRTFLSGSVIIGGIATTSANARTHTIGSGDVAGAYSLWATNSTNSATEPGLCVGDDLKVGIRTNSIDAGATLEVDGTTGGILFPRLTTTQRDALTPTNGLMIYNTTTSKFQGYAGGAWVDLH
jgi:hypothetical protein